MREENKIISLFYTLYRKIAVNRLTGAFKKDARNFRFLNHQAGFTLVEMLVVLALFSITTTVIVDIFMTATRAQRKTLAAQKIQSDARFSMEAMAREARMDMIDYAYYGGTISEIPTTVLALRDQDDNQIIFKKSNENCPTGIDQCLVVSIDGGNSWASITSGGIKVTSLNFYIAPTVDPFLLDTESGTYASDISPRVTITLTVEGVGTRPEEQKVISLQTTVSSRIYRR
jgi:prepilin-type N-terminal cleavage/methylation domain-containing protein